MADVRSMTNETAIMSIWYDPMNSMCQDENRCSAFHKRVEIAHATRICYR